MLGTTHQMIALLAALWVAIQYPSAPGVIVAVLSVVAVMIGALTPDLDQPTANIWRRLLGGRTVGNVFEWFSGGHRHMTHSLIDIIAIGALTHWAVTHVLNPAYVASALFIWHAFMIGYISHPVADTLTDQGVPWLWPLHIKIKIPPGPEEVRVTTGSWVETILLRAGVIIAAGLLIVNHWPTLLHFFTVSH